ncbi:hypothetical protein [Pseudonocardia sp. MH-G8]|uniref:hypothetical protein n=1 Tax=Pseudonocardia sp. MH-G8 TaxID=1854588 RepID=UPI000BA063F6|nr:hypothetical protein [Pseudonocardia sp. MH-G8]OZM82008.1 hypothetical protein CFP66_13900 [Pseudonocardia sp. MH-G8]
MNRIADPVASHVAELDRMLHGPGTHKRSMIAEVHDGLQDAADAYRAGGLEPLPAAAAAVQDFGPVREVAPLMQEELTVRQGRATALLLAVTFPAMVLGWDLLWQSGVGWPGPAPAVVAALARVQDVASFGIAAAALALLTATFRRTAAPRWITALTGLTAAGGALVCGGTAIVMNLAHAEQAGLMLTTRPLALVAVVASAVVLVVVIRSAVRSLRVAWTSTRSDQRADPQVG